MKNIQKQYQDLLEGKMSKQNFMRNVRMEFSQYVAPGNSYEDAINILKGKRILSEAAKPEGVYGHNSNAEAETSRGIDHLNYYQVYHGIQYELAKMPEITDENYIKARKKVVDTILKDPDAYKELQLANFKAVKAMDEDLKMKEVKPDNLRDKPNEMKVIKKDVKGNTEATLEKKEKKKSKDAGIKQMTQTPKKTKGVKVMEVPGKEKSLREGLNYRLAVSDEEAEELVGEIMSFKDLDGVERLGVVTSVSGHDGNQPLFIVKYKVDGETKKLQVPYSKMWSADDPLINFKGTNEDKVQALRENIMAEMTKINPEHEHFQAGTRVKKKDNSLVGEITEWDGDTATIKTDEGKIVHVQGNILTKKDVPSPKEEVAKTATTDDWANPKAHIPEDEHKVEESKEEKMKSLKEKLVKAVKKELEEDMFIKGTGPAAQTVTASSQASKSALTQKGFRAVPNTGDIKAI